MTDTAPSTPAPAAAVATANEVAAVAASVAAVQGGNPIVTEVASNVSAAATDVAQGKGISDVAASVIRTVTPYAVGAGLTALATIDVHIPAAYEGVIDGVATLVVGTAYYGIVRALEAKFPKLGWLLGVAKKPVYSV